MSGFPGPGPIAIFMPLLWALLAVLTILWIALPFAVFGVKRRLDRIADLLERSSGAPPGPAAAGATRAAAGVFAAIRREVLRTRTDVTEESAGTGRATLFAGSGARRTAVAEVRLRGDVVEVELYLGNLAARVPTLRPESVLARLEGELAGRPGFQVLLSREGHRVVIQVGPEAEEQIPAFASLLKTQVVDVLRP